MKNLNVENNTLHFQLNRFFLTAADSIPVDTGRKLNDLCTFKLLLNVLCRFSLRPVSTGILVQKTPNSSFSESLQFSKILLVINVEE